MTQTPEQAREHVANYALGTRPATLRVRAVAWLVAAWCVGFAAVNVAFSS